MMVHIGLSQENIALEKGKTYKVTVRAKSDSPRKFQTEIKQGNVSIHYSTFSLTEEMKEYSDTFVLEPDSDTNYRLNVFLGKEGEIGIEFDYIVLSLVEK